MSTKSPSLGLAGVGALRRGRARRCGRGTPSPPPPTTSAPEPDLDARRRRAASMRYCDMLSASVAPRTSRRDACRVPRQVQGGLPRGVAAADDVRDLARHALRLEGGRAVEHPRAARAPRARGRRAGGRTRRSRARRRGTDLVVGRRRAPRSRVALDAQTDRLPGVREPGAEDPGLLIGALRELGARDAPGEAEVVADQRARPRLAADRLALHDEHVRRPSDARVDRRGEARRVRRRPRPGRASRPGERGRRARMAAASSALLGSRSTRPSCRSTTRRCPGRAARRARRAAARPPAIPGARTCAGRRRGASRLRSSWVRASAGSPMTVTSRGRTPIDALPLQQELGDGAVEVLVGRVPRPDARSSRSGPVAMSSSTRSRVARSPHDPTR